MKKPASARGLNGFYERDGNRLVAVPYIRVPGAVGWSDVALKNANQR